MITIFFKDAAKATLDGTDEQALVSYVSDGSTELELKTPTPFILAKNQLDRGVLKAADNSFILFKGAGGTASTTRTDTSLLQYFLTANNLLQGTELTESDPSIPDVNNNKGYLTSAAESPLLDFYKAFAYNEDNYKLMVTNRNIEIAFLCSDRRYGVAGSRRGWSPYFKLNDLIKPTFTDIQNRLVGTDATPEYFFKAKVSLNANGNLFITVIDGHSGVNLYGSILNIRHRVVNG